MCNKIPKQHPKSEEALFKIRRTRCVPSKDQSRGFNIARKLPRHRYQINYTHRYLQSTLEKTRQ